MKKELTKTPTKSDFLPIVIEVHHQTEFIQFASWYGTPSQFREPQTQKQFARSIGVCVDTLTDWKKRPEFALLVFRSTKEWLAERVPDVLGSFYLKAMSDKVSAADIKLYLRLSKMGYFKE